jgi:hypothetical protein
MITILGGRTVSDIAKTGRNNSGPVAHLDEAQAAEIALKVVDLLDGLPVSDAVHVLEGVAKRIVLGGTIFKSDSPRIEKMREATRRESAKEAAYHATNPPRPAATC